MASKQPKLILRESCIDDVIQHWPAGRFLEMGAGTGYMTRLLLDRGYWGAASDLGESSRAMMRSNLADARERLHVFDDAKELESESFDYLFAFEVLEHVEDHVEVLKSWTRYLRKGGQALFSVPAHARKYGRSDELVGHVRRYEKTELRHLLEAAGFERIEIINYGFPLTEITRRVSNRLVANDASYDTLDAEQRSIRSAQAKPKRVTRLLSLASDRWFTPFRAIQRVFYQWDWRDGYAGDALNA